jgi:hypothetical protein
MEIDAEMRRKIVVSISSVAVFVFVFIGVGIVYGPELPSQGGLALVGAIVLFIFGMAAVGFILNE